MKRIVTIQDISGIGKCSATIALPVVSAMGVECAVMPTAVLSTHTGFDGFTFCDLTDQMKPIAEHWKEQKLGFDAIYTGYLGSFEQLKLVSSFIDDFKTEDNYVVIDPVMGDNGKLYTGFSPEFAASMARLCGKADLIVPNLTEASYMLNIPYNEQYTESDIRRILRALCDGGVKVAALTGIGFREGKTGVMSLSSATGEYFYYEHDRLPVSFHGTGDLFASACVGGMMCGLSVEQSLKLASDYTKETIAATLKNTEHSFYGVDFETTIPRLIEMLSCACKALK